MSARKTASIVRTRQRRAQRRRDQSLRQQRWRDARIVIEASKMVLCELEDKRLVHEINALVYRLDKYIKNTPDDSGAVLEAVRHGCWVMTDISDETGLPIAFIRTVLTDLCQEKKVQRVNNLYKPIEHK